MFVTQLQQNVKLLKFHKLLLYLKYPFELKQQVSLTNYEEFSETSGRRRYGGVCVVAILTSEYERMIRTVVDMLLGLFFCTSTSHCLGHLTRVFSV